MTTACTPARMLLPAVLAACAAIGLCGCQAIDFHESAMLEPVPPMLEPPREKALMSLPSYRIAAPDVLTIEMLKQVPTPPYRAEAFDLLSIHVVGTLPDEPIGPMDDYGNPTPSGGFYLIDAEGMVDLGATYGTVRVVGLTVDEMREAIEEHLLQVLAVPQASVQIARTSGTQELSAEYLVGPDGTVNLRQYGSVHVAGKTIAEAKQALEEHLSQYFDSPEVAVDVVNYNSKFYYIVLDGAGLGDSVAKIPVTGKETVLDALSEVGGLSEMSSKKIWIARPTPGQAGCQQILPVDYDAITRGASTATNYQILPHDRVFVSKDHVAALTNVIGQVTAPFRQAAGTSSLSVNTIRTYQTLGRGYNRNFRR